jgi:hypothetical protein
LRSGTGDGFEEGTLGHRRSIGDAGKVEAKPIADPFNAVEKR